MLTVRNWGLRRRTMAACTLLLLTTVLALSTALIWQSYWDSREDDVMDTVVMARFMSYSAEPYVLLNDQSALGSVLMAAATNKSVLHAEIRDTSGRVMATYTREGTRPEKSIDPQNPLSGPAGPAGSTVFESQSQLLVIVPIWSGTSKLQVEMEPATGREEANQRVIGYLALNNSLEQVNRELVRRIFSVLVIALVILAAGIFASFVGVRQFIEPIQRLASTAQAIAAGDLTRRAPELKTPELDILAGSFNHMADSLQQYTLNLEAEVRERTAALEESEAKARKLALVAANTNNGVIITDAEGRIEWVNDGFSRLTGYTFEEVVGRTPLDLLEEPDTDPNVMRQIRESVGRGEGFNVEVLQRTKPGEKRWIAMGAQPVHDRTERLTNFVAIQTDMTQRKQAEVQAEKAREAAEAANRAKSEFLANMSHEIRTPMNGILGMTQLALETELSTEQREYVQIVKDSAESLLHVINDVLDFSKIEAGRLDLDPISFSLRDCVVDTAKAQALLAHAKGLELVCHVLNDVPDALVGDPTRLRQILVNLIGNAVKFTEKGEILVRVAVEARTERDVMLRFSVRDTGIGIVPDKQRLIFEAFAQADGSTTRKYGGTGLGLAIASRLVNLMGGRIWVESEPGRGSTFHCTARFGVEAINPSRPVPARPGDIRDLPVLVVDDNTTNRRVLIEMLTNWGMVPEEVESGEQALACMERRQTTGQPYRLVLIDAMMPEMDGFALADRIRQNPQLAGATVMMLSSAGQPGDASRCRQLGMAGYLTKPVKQSELLDAILLALSTHETRYSTRQLVTRHTVRQRHEALRLLLAEDNLVNQKLAVRVLERQGHTVTVVGDGQQAVTAFLSQGDKPFDAILMDVQMPVMGGFEATAVIRTEEKRSGGHIPIVAMTANAMKGDRERCLEAGMDEYVPKPLDVDKLMDVLAGLAGNREHRAEPTAAPAAREPVAAGETHINLELALGRLEGDQELLNEVVETFHQHLPTMLQDLHAAADTHDIRALQHAAHSLKGAAASVCAEPTRRLAESLESTCRANRFEEADDILKDLTDKLAQLSEYLEASRCS